MGEQHRTEKSVGSLVHHWFTGGLGTCRSGSNEEVGPRQEEDDGQLGDVLACHVIQVTLIVVLKYTRSQLTSLR